MAVRHNACTSHHYYSSYMKQLRILITNNTLAGYGGTEVYARELAIALQKHGHYPILFSTELGTVANELHSVAIPVIDDLNKLAQAPDLIHGQHHLETMMALLHFPNVPAIYFCHGWLPWQEAAPHFPNIRKYVAVDDLGFQKLNMTSGIAESQIRIIHNAIKMDVFLPKRNISQHPIRAAIFSNDPAQSSSIHVIRAACLACGINMVDTLGAIDKNPIAQPQSVLCNYDIVFAKGRCALEALATGCAVVLSDMGRMGSIVTPENIVTLRHLNFGIRTMPNPVRQDALVQEIKRYNVEDITYTRSYIRENACFDRFCQRILTLYDEALNDDWTTNPLEQARAASLYIKTLRATFQRTQEYPLKMQQHIAVIDIDRASLKSNLERLKEENQQFLESLMALEQSRVWYLIKKISKWWIWLRARATKAN
jgi:glycosyltransferase involved in cell wall biosynthesis